RSKRDWSSDVCSSDLKYGLEDPVGFESLNKDVPAIKGEVRHAVEKEMALSLNDFMVRRAALLLFGNDQDVDTAKSVAEIMGAFLNWDEDEIERQLSAYNDYVQKHIFQAT